MLSTVKLFSPYFTVIVDVTGYVWFSPLSIAEEIEDSTFPISAIFSRILSINPMLLHTMMASFPLLISTRSGPVKLPIIRLF